MKIDITDAKELLRLLDNKSAINTIKLINNYCGKYRLLEIIQGRLSEITPQTVTTFVNETTEKDLWRKYKIEAMLLMMLEKGIQVDEIYFADTGVEFPELYEYIDKVEEYIGQPIIRLQPKKSWDDWFYATYKRGKRKGEIYGFPAVVYGCWARPRLKTEQLDKIHLPNSNVHIGIAADEEERTNRKAYTNSDCNYKFPLVEWGMTEQDCINYLAEKELENPLYERFSRLGCWMCPKQNLKSLRSLYLYYPNLWVKLKKYEKDSPHGFRLDYTLDELELRFKIVNEFLQQYEIPDNPKLRKVIIKDLKESLL